MKSNVILVFMLIIFCHIAHEVIFRGITYENAIGLHVLYVLMYVMWLQIVCPPKKNNKNFAVISIVSLMMTVYFVFLMNEIKYASSMEYLEEEFNAKVTACQASVWILATYPFCSSVISYFW